MFCDEEELTTLYGWIDEIEGLTRYRPPPAVHRVLAVGDTAPG